MKIVLSQNTKRWLVEFVCTVLGLMVLDDGMFVIIQTAAFLLLELLLLFLPTQNILRSVWVCITIFVLIFFGLSILY